MRVLEKIEQQNYNVLARRPAISKFERRTIIGWEFVARAVALEASYGFCQKIARTRARNFYYSFLLLSREQRDAMCAIYAFMRYCDDISEGEGASREAIEQWRRDLDLRARWKFGENLLWPAFHDTVKRYQIPHEYFYQMIEGVSSDSSPSKSRHSMNCIATAIRWRAWWDSPSFTSSALNLRMR